MRAVLLLALSLLLAGCITSSVRDDVEEPLEEAAGNPLAALAEGLPCAVPYTSGLTDNLRPVAENELADLGYPSYHGELWMQGDLAFVARYNTGGVDIVDVSDPTAPRHLSYWDPDQADRGLDVKATLDGLTVLVGGDRSIKLVSIKDPLAPVLEGEHVFEKAQAHMLTVFPVGDSEYVAVPKAEAVDLVIYRIDGEPGARTLTEVSRPALTLLGTRTGEGLLQSHDTFFRHDPILDKPLLWVANVWDGITALDVSDPASPVVVSRIPQLDPYQGYTHTVQTYYPGDRRITVSVGEVGLNALKVYDTTDLKNPRLLALWSAEAPLLPQHNLQIVGDHAYVAHYAQGTYVFDLSKIVPTAGPAPGRLAPMAHLPAKDDGSKGAGPANAFSGTWDVVVHRGLVYTTDIDTGLRVTAFGCIVPGDPSASSIG